MNSGWKLKVYKGAYFKYNLLQDKLMLLTKLGYYNHCYLQLFYWVVVFLRFWNPILLYSWSITMNIVKWGWPLYITSNLATNFKLYGNLLIAPRKTKQTYPNVCKYICKVIKANRIIFIFLMISSYLGQLSIIFITFVISNNIIIVTMSAVFTHAYSINWYGHPSIYFLFRYYLWLILQERYLDKWESL